MSSRMMVAGLILGIVMGMGIGQALPSFASSYRCERDRFPATVERWVDGDTAVVSIDLGLDVVLKGQYLRLARVNTPERGQPGYDEATKLSERTCSGDVEVVISGKGKYGRWISEVVCNGVNLNDKLRARGWTYD